MSSENEPLSKKPEDSDFQQQRLKAWQPLLTPKWVIGTFILICVVFIPIGVAIVVASGGVEEVTVRYDHLTAGAVLNPTYPDSPYPASCAPYLYKRAANNSKGEHDPGCKGDANSCFIDGLDYWEDYTGRDAPTVVQACSIPINITLEHDMDGPVYFYYKLTNYYQNHRRYVKSRSDTQLASDSGGGDTSTCDPLETDSQGRTYYPCGLIAGSFFIDRFSATLQRAGAAGPTPLGNWSVSTPNWQKDGIAWSSDKSDKFKLNRASYEDDVNFNHNGLLGVRLPPVNDEDFIVWMRTAGLPTFKKLYRKIDTSLKKGDVVTVYALNYYPVEAFDGSKSIVLSTTSWMGGKNSFLGWAYIVVGIICFVLAAAFAIKHLVSPRPLGDMSYFNWPGSAAGSTGRGH